MKSLFLLSFLLLLGTNQLVSSQNLEEYILVVSFLSSQCLSVNEFACLEPNGTLTCLPINSSELSRCNFTLGLASCQDCTNLGFQWCYAVNETSYQNTFVNETASLCGPTSFCSADVGFIPVSVSSASQCPSNCTRSTAYWRKHNSLVCPNIPWPFGLENNTICNSTFLSLLNADDDDDDRQNIIVQLEQQLITLDLNIAAGDEVDDNVIDDIQAALSFLNSHCDGHLSNSDKNIAKTYRNLFKNDNHVNKCPKH